jgi:NAD/NADP transhydrogenase beta subunit
MSPNIAALLYLASGVLFLLALRGLSSPESSRQGNQFGMTGMAIAVLTTLGQMGASDSILTWSLIIFGLCIGGGFGAFVARNIPMTSMPELVAAFHSLVGLAAVFVAAGALYAPEAFRHRNTRRYRAGEPAGNVTRRRNRRHHLHRLGDRLCQAIGTHVRQADHPAGIGT